LAKEEHVTVGFRILAAETLAVAALVTLAACGGGNSPMGPSGGGGGSSAVVGATSSVGPIGATITIGTGGVSPSQVTVSVGQSVTFVNNDTRSHVMNSDPHPVHTDCPSINNVATLTPGQSKSTLGFAGTGSCGFHDHNDDTNPSLRGRIIIQ
jgi:plastocyanin